MALKAAKHVRTPLVFLSEHGREGLFEWTPGDFAVQCATDTQEGIFIESSHTANTTGAWVRVGHEREWRTEWFGLTLDAGPGTGPYCDAEAIPMLLLGNIVKPQKISFGAGIYSLGAALPEISWQVEISGVRAQQSTIVVKHYVEPTSDRGVFAFNDHGFIVRNLSVRATSGSGGSGISAILTGNAPAAGRSFIENVTVSGGDYFDQSLCIDGHTNTAVEGPSYRGVWVRDSEFFGAASSAIKLRSVHHIFMSGLFIATSGGTGTSALIIAGDVEAYNDDVHIFGIISGNTTMTRLSRSSFHSPLNGNVVNDDTCNSIAWFGANFSGVHQQNWANSAYITS